ncbi:glucuronate isomerase [Neobacillus niacini]|uniref:glucuronate isomerase n=1 Tax=Neobacillus niacini TaxID=86668 RepID=UPI0021CB2607|nr:glucuronate isomerase [Neobacillus niacini]MCM3768243.1 glucuronate isomerase [Neobacillus niacini]
MGAFIHDNFMLKNKTAVELYHKYAKDMPIYDYHCHLSPKDIAENRKFNTITELWLEGDHYKWRGMRANGIDERFITGDASDKEKFEAWAKTVPNTLGNPLYHWTHLELKKYFGIEELLNEDTWERIWEQCNALLQQDDYSVQGLIKRSNVKVICTTDDPTDDLHYHEQIKGLNLKDFPVKVLPTYRPDKGVEINKDTFTGFVGKLEEVIGKKISSFEDYLSALEERVEYFHEKGGRISDHGLSEIPFASFEDKELDAIFQAGRNGQTVSTEDENKFKTAVLIHLAKCYKELDWAMQIHFGAIRNNNTKMFSKLGPDAGYDSISDQGEVAVPLNALLAAFDEVDGLPKTILYNLNPIHNELVGSTLANFQTEAGVQGKIQLGSGWWFNDTKQGMIRQMNALADQGLLMHFVGMLTDSRSFISYSRHEYFRRILCNLVGEWVEDGEVPNDEALLKKLIENICYNNAKKYFSIEV